MGLYRRIDLPSDEPVQFVGVHALVWGRTGGAKVGFVEAEDDGLLEALSAFPDWHDYGLCFECGISPGAQGVIEWIADVVKWQAVLKESDDG